MRHKIFLKKKYLTSSRRDQADLFLLDDPLSALDSHTRCEHAIPRKISQ